MTNARRPGVLHIAHSSPGRLRVRVPALRNDRDGGSALADALADLDGVIDVTVRPRTGSVLCRYDARRIGAARLIALIRHQTGSAAVRRAGKGAPGGRRPSGSSLGRQMVALFQDLDAEVTEATGGRLDLGTLAGLGMLGAGAAEIAVTRTIPAPPWFSLAWWAFRTFTMFERPSQGASRGTGKKKPSTDSRILGLRG